MTEPRELREIVGDDVPAAELQRLAEIDAVLRATPAPPTVPESLTAAVLALPGKRGPAGRRRLVGGLALAAALAGATFGLGVWVGGEPGPSATESLTLSATPNGPPGARMTLHLLPVDSAGNWAMAADVSGLPALSGDGYYEVWMTRHGALAVSCGRFVTDATGAAKDVWLNAPYDFEDYDRWVVVAVMPGGRPSSILLDGPVAGPTANA